MFTYLQQSSSLHRLNPAVKLLAIGIVTAGATLAFDPFIPGMLLLGLWVTTWIVGKFPLRRMIRWSLPVLVLPIPILIFTALYADINSQPGVALLWTWGPWKLSMEGILEGTGLGLRVATFITGSLLFITTTDPADFAVSLIQNLRIPYRFGYGVLVSFRFLPLLRTEFDTIRMAHRVRGVGEKAGITSRLEQFKRYAIPLLAAAIRKSERTAIAMDAKAFASGPDRTYYRVMKITRQDILFLCLAFLYTILVYTIAVRSGLANLQWIPA